MRILMLHLFDLDLTGGSGTHLRAVRHELHEWGHDVEVVSARFPDRFGCTDHPLPFAFTLTFGPEVRPGERRLEDLGDNEFGELVTCTVTSVLERFRDRQAPDLVLVNHISLLAVVASRLCQQWGKPYRIISFGTDTDLLRRAPRYVSHLAAPTAGADRLFAISGFVSREIQALLPVHRVDVLGAAADKHLFSPDTAAGYWQPVITYVGRLVTEKGLWVLLDAMERARHVERLDIIGEGPLYAALQRRLQQAGPGFPVALVGTLRHEELRPRLVSSAAVVVPSTWQEPLALVVAEALACGVPVIASDVGGIAEMVVDGVNGLVVPPGDADALARAVDRISGNKAFAQQLRRGCVERTRVPSYSDVARRLIGDLDPVASRPALGTS
jgi:glycosyltransferase involved in cell wall biosynthesis